MLTKVKTSEILVDQDHVYTDDELFDAAVLPADQQPIVLDHKYNLIDGGKRLFHAIKKGRNEVPAYIAETYEEACDYLNRNHPEGFNPSMKQVRMIVVATNPLLWESTRRRRMMTMEARQANPLKKNSSRRRLMEALNLVSPSAIQIMASLYNYTKVPGEIGATATRIMNEIESGALTLHQGGRQWDLFQADHTKSRKPQDQQKILSGVCSSIPGLVASFSNLPSSLNEELSLEDLAEWDAVLASTRSLLTITHTKIRTAIKEKS